MVKVFDCWSVSPSSFENWLELINVCIKSYLIKMIIRIESYLSYYLGHRSWLLCRLRQKWSMFKQVRSLTPTVWTCLIVRYGNVVTIPLVGFDSRYPPTPHCQGIGAMEKTRSPLVEAKLSCYCFFRWIKLFIQIYYYIFYI